MKIGVKGMRELIGTVFMILEPLARNSVSDRISEMTESDSPMHKLTVF